MIDNLIPFEDLAYYSAHFMDPCIWEPYIREICREHGYSCERIAPGVAGTYPTFIVTPELYGSIHGDTPVVLKFFGPPFDGEAVFHVEVEIARWLQGQSLPVPSPAIYAEGRIDERWNYLVFEYIPGISVNQARSELTRDDLTMIARQMGETMQYLHTHSSAIVNKLFPDVSTVKNGYQQFLREQQERCLASHRSWSDLPEHLLEGLEDFLVPVEELVDPSPPMHLIHADLTGDHLLGRMERGTWQSLAIIDWGDARQGNILYELVALHLDLFKGDRQLLKVCLESYHLPDFYHQDFSRKAFCMALLHQFPLPAFVYTSHHEAHSLQELAERLFGVHL